MPQSSVEHFDVLIVGAGLSGIGAAYHLQTRAPTRSYAIFEGRDAIGGTWDLFRYPGIRSDSDMFTLGYRFRPWTEGKAIADGPSIKAYIESTARENRIDEKIRFGHRVVRAEWSTSDAQWSITAEIGEARKVTRFTCSFLYMCTGYYDYASGYTPELPGREKFRGTVVHPQLWPDDLDYTGKRVVVIGSGATAITLVPSMAEKAGHVTMLQRSPTYVVSLPAVDPIAKTLRRILPEGAAYAATRWKNVVLGIGLYQLSRRRPELMKKLLRKGARSFLGPDYDLDRHFKPRYEPWDERLCVAPDGDFFRAIKSGRASVVTDTIDTFTETGIRLASGEHLDADVIITATGLNAKIFSGLVLTVDGKPVDLSKSVSYKGMMYSDVPNLASAVGYTNASWTLKCDLIAEHVCRILEHMRRNDLAIVTPRVHDASMETAPLLDLRSGYVQRALGSLPRQGMRPPWRLHQNYVRDLLMMRFGRVNEEALEFAPKPRASVAARKSSLETVTEGASRA